MQEIVWDETKPRLLQPFRTWIACPFQWAIHHTDDVSEWVNEGVMNTVISCKKTNQTATKIKNPKEKSKGGAPHSNLLLRCFYGALPHWPPLLILHRFHLLRRICKTQQPNKQTDRKVRCRGSSQSPSARVKYLSSTLNISVHNSCGHTCLRVHIHSSNSNKTETDTESMA